ncbi:MAG TPA: choice-of-anchor tandem repeat NxxGxxAF-containing protein [Candidatus Eisenbacteria bacterium]|nr:choice-of-anchor tandem repeat NxxGxxAF-containing protein [Candidatus Eisenbacteria bacterium]
MPSASRLPILVLALVALAAPSAGAQVRALLLQGDGAPGALPATFTSFNTSWPLPVCDASGHFAGMANVSTGATGLWTDDLGSLQLVAITGGTGPWSPGTATFQSFLQPILSDNAFVLFGASALTPASANGLWIQDGSGLALVAGSGLPAPGAPGPATYTVPGTGTSWCLNSTGHAALNTGSAIWAFDPPPSVNAFNVAATSFPSPGFEGFELMNYNSNRVFGLYLLYFNGSSGIHWIADGTAGAIGPVLANGDLAPPSGSSIPSTANISGLETGGVMPDLNGANALVFRSTLFNGGVTSANDEVVWLHDGTGFHVVLREGDTVPELLPGETLAPGLSANTQAELVSDAGSVTLFASILPSKTPAVLIYRPDRTLHVLARDMAPAPGYPGRLLGLPATGSPGLQFLEMNRHGQVLMQCFTRDSLNPNDSGSWVNVDYVTDLHGNLTPLFRDGDTYTVRAGLTGQLQNFSPQTMPYPSGGSDGRPRNFTDHGEYIFRGRLLQNGGATTTYGYFAVQGPDVSTLAADPNAPTTTRLDAVAPNPTTGVARVEFDLARPGRVRLEVFDLAGRSVRMLSEGELDAGHHSVRWAGVDDAGRPVGRGIYFVRLSAPGTSAARRLVVLRF